MPYVATICLVLAVVCVRPDEFCYAVFGRVIDGMDVVGKIERVKTNNEDVPQSLIMIMRVYVKGP